MAGDGCLVSPAKLLGHQRLGGDGEAVRQHRGQKPRLPDNLMGGQRGRADRSRGCRSQGEGEYQKQRPDGENPPRGQK